ncbi:MAG: class I SAM-dependent methyltransferase [Myxococcota bacterium]
MPVIGAPRPLSARLHAIANAIPAGARVADVGTDHAQLLAWLHAAGRITRGIGIDRRPGPLAQARHTLHTTNTVGVELRLGDGLTPLRPDEVDTAVLAGLGGLTMVRLLEAAPAIVERLTGLVLQPNTDWTEVRRFIARRGWSLEDESMVEDRNKFYVVLRVDPRPGPPLRWSEDELLLGPLLLLTRPPAHTAWIHHELRRIDRALHRIERHRDQNDPRAQDLRTHARRLRRALPPER